MIIDAHAHIVSQIHGQTAAGPTRPAGYGRMEIGEHGVRQLLPPLREDTTFPPQVLLALMDWVGIDKAVLLQGPFYGEANERVSQAVGAWPDRFIGAAYVDPRADGAEETFLRCVEGYGFRIIKLELSEDAGLVGLYPDLRLDEPQMAWLWDEAEQRNLVVTLDLGTIGTRSYQTDAVRAVLDRHPRLRVVIAHLGHPPVHQSADAASRAAWVEQILLARSHNVWHDLAALPIYWPSEDYPYPTARDYVRQAVDLVGPDKLLWGTDVPGLLAHATYHQLLGLVTRHCDFLSESDLAKVLGANAWEIYGGAGTTSD